MENVRRLKYRRLQLFFFDKLGVRRQPNGLLRVWTKCISRDLLDGVDINSSANKEILEGTARKMAAYYLPPFATITDMKVDQLVSIIGYEEIANKAALQPTIRIMYEIDCRQDRIRALDTSLWSGSQYQHSSKVDEWSYITPEGNARNLRAFSCSD